MAPWLVDVPSDHVHYVHEYTDVEAVLDIARMYGLDAIYPGYGFLAENASFAERVRQAGLRFIGPTPETLRALGEKDAAMALARQLGLPTVPGDDALILFAHNHSQEDITQETIQRTLALGQQYPGTAIRLKHPAGGGGKGQRVLSASALQTPEAPQLIVDALAKVWAEVGVTAAAADHRKGVLLELNLARPLHWEVQLFGDGETVVHFAARDCSLQNQGFQKFIELALYPDMFTLTMRQLDPCQDMTRLARLQQRRDTLGRLCEAAVRLGTAVHLCGAATVEFLIDQQGAPYFLEVNPRIQVEHAVTESITRIYGSPVSLVELQQRVAAGEALDFRQTDITFVGDAIEVRLNAWHEDLSPVLGGVIHALHCDVAPALRAQVRLEAGGLLQRREPWLIPSYDANFALLVVTGAQRQETLACLLTILETALQIRGNTALHTNLQSLLGLLTLMQAVPLGTELRTDTSQLWMAWAAIIVAQKQTVLSLLPTLPRQLHPHDPARFARLLHATLEAAFAHPSRLLAYYLRRLSELAPRPLAALEVLWQLVAELRVPLFAEERTQGESFQAAVATLWEALSESHQRLTALVEAARARCLEHNRDYSDLCTYLQATDPTVSHEEAVDIVGDLLAWLTVDIPAITALIKVLESTQLHTCLATSDDLLLARPAYLADEASLLYFQRLLSASLRPTVLQQGILLAPMAATIYHRPAPDAPPFVEIGVEVKVGQTLALLEAMKMFTELVSPVDGKLIAILVEDRQGVHTGTPLFQFATYDDPGTSGNDILSAIINRPWQQRFGLLAPQPPTVSRVTL
jgi:acetyl/propionyl-CoA carboxylase alpha subunit